MSEVITKGSGNIFADLGLEDAEEMNLKAALAVQVVSIIRHRRLNQSEAGAILGVPQSHVSRIMNARLDGFTAEKLIRMLLMFGRDIDIVVKKRRGADAPGRLIVENYRKRTVVAA